MDPSQMALKLILEGAGVGVSIETIDDRKSVQKTVYLVQAAGLNLGYQYNWYVKGPYSPKLAREYYNLDRLLISADPEEFQGTVLRPTAAKAVACAREMMNIPDSVVLDRPRWLELLASVHYWDVARSVEPHETEAVLQKEKPGLAPYVTEARETLSNAGVLG